jgi:hypothetical protein
VSEESAVQAIALKALREESDRCLHENRAFDAADAMAALKPLLAQVEQVEALRATNARLNRRCQAAEAAALQNVKACVSSGLSFSRTLANWYALRLVDELRACLPLCGPEILEGYVIDGHRRRILNTLPDESDLKRWRQKQTQPKASVRDGETKRMEVECEVCGGPCQGH